MVTDPFDLSRLASPPAPREAPYLSTLNPEQRAAVEALEGPVLVLAGAGTGKTRVLTTRLAHILATGRAWPNQVLAVTFTNKAAREMIARIESLLGRSLEGLWLGTFHAMAARILRRHAELMGLTPSFTIIDDDDQIRLLKQLLEAANIDDKRWPARALSIVVQRWKDRGLGPDRVEGAEGSEFANGRAVDLYRAYQERLKVLNAADFGDLLLHNLVLLNRHPDVLARYQQQFRFILVDEYQDANVAQYLWLRLLAQGRRNLCCVGDDDQSIYGWRGAEVANILRFDQDFPGAQVLRLERNYRSTPHILGAASGLIAHNAGRLGKTLWSERTDSGEKVRVIGLWDGAEEARTVADSIESLQRRERHVLSEIAVLVRAGFQTRLFEERFLEVGLPYRVIGGLRFYERQEIRDAVAYIRMLAQPDDGLAFERILNVPKRGLGDAVLQTLHRTARNEGVSLPAAAAQLIATDEIRPRQRTALRELLAQFAVWRAQLSEKPHPEVVQIVLDESGYTEMWQRDRSPTAPGRLENLKELIRALEEFETLDAFLDHVSLVMDLTETAGSDLVNVMTLHSAKGLEFDTVFLPGWEEGLFPHQLALDEKGAAGLEEERRLAYVGLTRARRRATVLWAANRHVYNQWVSSIPSRFIDELPKEHIEIETLIAAAVPRSLPSGAGFSEDSPVFGPPGFHSRRARRTLKASYRTSAAAEESASAFAIGQRIFHQKFGYGRVLDVEGNKLAIAFDKAGEKKVIASFVEPA